MEFNAAAHDYLYSVLGGDSHVLELGSGEGTANLVHLFKTVTTVEHDVEFLNKVEGAAYIHAPLLSYKDEYFREAKWWYDPCALKKQLPQDYDAIFIDGPKRYQGRGGFFTYFDLFKQDVLFVFDDVHRLWEFRLMGKIAARKNRTAIVHPEDRWFGVIS